MQQEEDSTLVNDSDSSCYIANSADNDPRTPVSKTNDDLAIDLQQPLSEAYSGSYILPDFEGCNDYSNLLSLCNNESEALLATKFYMILLTQWKNLSWTVSDRTTRANLVYPLVQIITIII